MHNINSRPKDDVSDDEKESALSSGATNPPQSSQYLHCGAPNGLYSFKNLNSGKMMDLSACSLEDGFDIQQYDDNGTDAQKFYIEAIKGDEENGVYKIKNKASGKYLGITDGSTDDGAKVNQWSDTGNDSQKWRFQFVGRDVFKIINVGSGLPIAPWNKSKESEAKLIQYTFNSGDNYGNEFKWIMIPLEYALQYEITGFDFGDDSAIQKLLNGAVPECADRKKVNNEAGVSGLTVGFTLSGTKRNVFSFGFNESTSFGSTTQIRGGINFKIGDIGFDGGAEHTFSKDKKYGSNEDITMETTQSFETSYSFVAPPGKFECGLLVFVTEDAKLPFNATVEVTADDQQNQIKCAGDKVEAMMKENGFSGTITAVNPRSVTAQMSGTCTANFAFHSEVYVKKVD